MDGPVPTPRQPDYETRDKGHGRWEFRQIRVSTSLVGYSQMPGLAQVAEVRSQVTHLKTGLGRVPCMISLPVSPRLRLCQHSC